MGSLVAVACASLSATSSAGSASAATTRPIATAAPATAAPATPLAAAGAPTLGGSSPVAAVGLTLQIREDPRLGKILTDSAGRALYRYDNDTKGASNCAGACAASWPPLVLRSGDPKGPTDLKGDLTTLARSDGGRQVTYNDAPLYYFVSDTASNDTKGEGVGGVWHVVRPAA